MALYSILTGLLIWKDTENEHAVIEGLRNSFIILTGLLIWKDTENEHAIIEGLRNSFIIHIAPNALFLSFPFSYFITITTTRVESHVEQCCGRNKRRTAVEERIEDSGGGTDGGQRWKEDH